MFDNVKVELLTFFSFLKSQHLTTIPIKLVLCWIVLKLYLPYNYIIIWKYLPILVSAFFFFLWFFYLPFLTPNYF